MDFYDDNRSKAQEHFSDYFDALKRDDSAILRELLRDPGTRPNDIDEYISDGGALIHIAAGQNATNCLRLLLQQGAHPDNQSLHGYTALYGARSLECVDVLVSAGANVHGGPEKANGYETPLHSLAAPRGCSTSMEDNVAAIKHLLTNGANPNAQDMYGNTPLHEACQGGTVENVHALIEAGSDVNAQTNEGRTPLMTALSHRGDRQARQFVETLIGAGANAALRDNTGASAQDIAKYYGHTESLALLQRHEMKQAMATRLESGDLQVRQGRKM